MKRHRRPDPYTTYSTQHSSSLQPTLSTSNQSRMQHLGVRQHDLRSHLDDYAQGNTSLGGYSLFGWAQSRNGEQHAGINAPVNTNINNEVDVIETNPTESRNDNAFSGEAPSTLSILALGDNIDCNTIMEGKSIQLQLSNLKQLPKSAPFKARTSAFDNVRRAAWKWLGDHATEQPETISGFQSVMVILQRCDNIQRQLIEECDPKQGDYPFPMERLSEKEVQKRQETWDAILGNQAGLRIREDSLTESGFRGRTLGELATLMSTQAGADLLHYLALNKGRSSNTWNDTNTVDITDNLISRSNNESSYTVAKYALVNNNSNRHLMRDTDTKHENLRRIERPEELFDAIQENSEGILLGNTPTAFGPGDGSIVKMDKNIETDTHRNAGLPIGNTKRHADALRLRWVTLGHELGHAASNRAGACGTGTQGDALFTATTPNIWDRKAYGTKFEERSNIERHDNGIRKEVGLPLRSGHGSQATMNALAIRRSLSEELKKLATIEPLTYLLPMYRDLQELAFSGTRDGREDLQNAQSSLETLRNSYPELLQKQLEAFFADETKKIIEAAGGTKNFRSKIEKSSDWDEILKQYENLRKDNRTIQAFEQLRDSMRLLATELRKSNTSAWEDMKDKLTQWAKKWKK